METWTKTLCSEITSLIPSAPFEGALPPPPIFPSDYCPGPLSWDHK